MYTMHSPRMHVAYCRIIESTCVRIGYLLPSHAASGESNNYTVRDIVQWWALNGKSCCVDVKKHRLLWNTRMKPKWNVYNDHATIPLRPRYMHTLKLCIVKTYINELSSPFLCQPNSLSSVQRVTDLW